MYTSSVGGSVDEDVSSVEKSSVGRWVEEPLVRIDVETFSVEC